MAQLPQDSAAVKKDTVVSVTDGIKKIDSVIVNKDSVAAVETALSTAYASVIKRTLQQNRYVNAAGRPVATMSREMPVFSSILFYLVLGVVLFFALLRFFSERYFNNMFRVFFNTSLRQGQLTDQLLQAKQVSLFFNMLFTITAGLYVYLLLGYFNWLTAGNPLMAVAACTLVVAVIYFLKYLSLKLTGWLTGYAAAANTYLFIIFLINKILGILLLPFVVIIGFGAGFLHYPAIIISLLMIGMMFLLRFLRSYGLLRRDIKVSRFHFFLYIAGVELIPLLLIYKGLMILLGKNL